MRLRQTRWLSTATAIRVNAVIVLAACASDVAAPPASDLAARHAKGSTTTVKVTSAAPDSGVQNTTIDVTVSGSGFEARMVATWKLKGVADSTQIRTNSTRYVSSRQLVANITISGTATLAKWDIEVMNKGKGGIGTELFTVKTSNALANDPQAHLVFDESVNVAADGQPAVMAPALITGDYRTRTGAAGLTGSSGEYQGLFCGVETILRRTDGALNVESDHGYRSPDMDAACGGKRYYNFYLSGRASAPLQYGAQHYAWDMWAFQPGESRLQGLMFSFGGLAGCNALHFNDAYPPANHARVTRLPDSNESGVPVRRWRVESRGSHRAMCTKFSNKGPVPTGTTYYLPFAYTFTEVPYPFPRYP